MSLGMRSGVNCTREKAERQRLRHRLHEQRLREARHADEHHVSAGQHGGDEIIDDLGLADDAAGDLCAQLGACFGKAREQREVVCARRRCGSGR